jgi:hypothetical protein
MNTKKRLKWKFLSEKAAQNFVSLKKLENSVSDISVKGSTVYWTEETSD